MIPKYRKKQKVSHLRTLLAVKNMAYNDKVRVVFSEEYERPDHASMVELCAELMEKYRCVHAYLDGANPGFISSLKSSIGKDPKYIEAIARLQKSHAKPELNMKVLPVNFAKEHEQLRQNLKMMLSGGLLAIDRRFEKLANHGQCH